MQERAVDKYVDQMIVCALNMYVLVEKLHVCKLEFATKILLLIYLVVTVNKLYIACN